jgi:hypothetical protein
MKPWRRTAALAAAILALAACGTQAPPSIMGVPVKAVFVGYLRQGFEQSDFYPIDNVGLGPRWVTVAEGEQAKLDAHARGEGRGRAITVQVLLQAEERGSVDFGIRPAFANSLHVNRVLSVEPITDAAFQSVAEEAQASRR